MNLANDGARYGADQYRFAHCYDLKRKTLMVSADSKNYTIGFAGKEKLTFDSGGSVESYTYECLKIEDDTYFVLFGTNIAVFELNQGLATLILPEGYVYGAIQIPGEAISVTRHSSTEEMIGTAVCWVLGCDKYVNHIYFSADRCRSVVSVQADSFEENSMTCTKIKDGIYLVDIVGPVPESACAPAGSDRMVLLEDYEHMMLVGCIFGASPPLMISGHGEFPEFEKQLLA